MKKLFLIIVILIYFLPFGDGIISLAPNITKMLIDLNLANSIVATVKEDNFPNGVKIGHFSHVKFEKIIRLKPNYIFCVGMGQDKIYNKLKKMGLNIHKINIMSIKDLKNNYLFLGEILQREHLAQSIVNKINKFILEFPKIKGNYIGIIWYTPMVTFGSNTFQGELIQLLGLKNTIGNIKKWYKVISKETVVRKNPDYFFIFIKKGAKIKRKILTDKAYKKLSFVKKHHIYLIENCDDFFQPSIRSLYFVKHLEKILEENEQ